MTRIIKTSTPGKERARLSKAIIITIRELMRHKKTDRHSRDMIAFIILALKEIAKGIDKSVSAWEKRGYWVKADKYRMEWQWSGQYAEELQSAFKEDKWDAVLDLLLKLMEKFNNIKVSDRHRMGKPWEGAYSEYKNQMK